MKAEMEKAKEWDIPVYRLWENGPGVMVMKEREEETE